MSRLPRWIRSGAFILALLAGAINAIGLLGFQHQAVSHLSGTATLLGTQLFNNWTAAGQLAAILVSFLIGSAISGFMLSNRSLRLVRQYEWLLCLEGVMLIASACVLMTGNLIGILLASGACGLQNAFATTFSGAVVRTTHVTGIFTDLGIMLGASLRGEPFDRRKAALLITIVAGFVFGGVAGALLFSALAFSALFVPAGLCIALALVYRIYRKRFAYTSRGSHYQH
jgi:uncharacterized membrane protein YoaK (UPF0700 family)